MLLTDCARAGAGLALDLQVYTGVGNLPPQYLSVELQSRSAAVEKLCYDLSVPLDILAWASPDSPEAVRLGSAIRGAVNLIDLREPQSEDFFRSVEAADAYLETHLYANADGGHSPIAACIGHTHIDVAWLWTVQQTREKAVRSFTTALKLMDEYPEYKFMSSQPQLYTFVKERYPEVFEKIRQRVAEGRWEAEGGMWLEADCNLISGESMVRQFLYGKKFFREEFGKENRILWLPDVFGYSAAMPQIMKKCGVDYFMTTKISWNQFNKLPVDSFWWKGLDGTEVLTHMITTQDAAQDKSRHFTTYNGFLNTGSVIKSWERYQQKDCSEEVLLSCGFGDGGGGTTREMIENARRLSHGIAGTPKVRWEFAGEFFDRLAEKARETAFPRWAGELYLEYHRGTYTSMARNKKSNRKAELMWQGIEFYSEWAKRLGAAYPAEEIAAAWKTILLNQFHDILPGSSIHEVYEVTAEEYRALEEKGSTLLGKMQALLAAHSGAGDGDFVVFNPLSFSRDCVVELPQDVAALRGPDGALYTGQRTETGTVFSLPRLPAMGCAVYTPAEAPDAMQPPFTVRGDTLETPFYRVRFAPSGAICSLYDKEAEREVVREDGRLNRLTAYEDKPMNYDNWDIDIFYTEKSWPLDECKTEWVEVGPVRAVLRVTRTFLHSAIWQDIRFYADRREIVFDTEIDWKQHQVLLKADFDLDVHADSATYDIQFGNVSRPTHRNTSWDTARFEVCAHKWADLSEGGYGAALLNDCKYGHSAQGSTLSLTLLKSGVMPNPTADQEVHRFRYALLPHAGDWRQADVPQAAYSFNVPAAAYRQTGPAAPGVMPAAFASLQADGVMLETVKQAEDGADTILRLYEYKNCRTSGSVSFPWEIESVRACNLLEDPESEVPHAGNRFDFAIKPYEISTYRVRFRA